MDEPLSTPDVVERIDDPVSSDPAVPQAPMPAMQETPRGEAAALARPAPLAGMKPKAANPGMDGGSPAALLGHEASEQLRRRWNEIQGMFVDEPRSAVQQADALVSEVIDQVIQTFTSERSSLEGQWKHSEDVSTENLRQTLQRYRAFFNRFVV